ncbi:DMT family transporter [Cohnella fermenti]|uniref:DMT family transporter n=1 Tax=Cohnella fermenti TaxID=2565925 RepID=A0A4S4CE57_9BACL|nr:DMT family transporter [Cohnella fermenti]THF84258.1 DMT family transporter [Cohnella fermenti]
MLRLLYAALIVLGLIWGGSFLFVKELLHDFGPWTISFIRSSFGLVTITAIMLALRQPFGWRSLPWPLMAVTALVNTALPWTLIGFSETRLTSSMASILNATTPLWTVVIGVLIFRTAASRMQWLGMGIAFAGLLVLLDINPHSIVSVDIAGFAGMLGATLCYGFGSQLSARFREATMYQVAFGTLLIAMLVSGTMAFSTEAVDLGRLASPSALGSAVGLGVFGSGVAYILFYFMVQKGGPTFASMVTYLVPGTAIIWGVCLLDEPAHWTLFVGMACILCGVFVSSRKRRQGS